MYEACLLRIRRGLFLCVNFWFNGGVEWWIFISSNVDSLEMTLSSAATSASTPLPGTFLGLAIDLGLIDCMT